MNISKRTALQAAAWTTVGVIGLGAVGELANARTASAPATVSAQATGADDDKGDRERKEGRKDGRRGGHKGRGERGHKGFPGRILHGEATVKGKDGVIRVVVTQSGEITAASPTSITVKSDDGYTSTWTLTAATKVRKGREEATAADLKVGDTVRVMGEKTAAGVITKHVGVRRTNR